MKNEQFEQQALSYLKGRLNATEEEIFLSIIEKDGAKKRHFEELKQLYKAALSDKMETPDDTLKEGFYKMLSKHQSESKNSKSILQRFELFLEGLMQYKRIAQLAMLLVIGLVSGFVGFQLNSNSSKQELQTYAQKIDKLNTELTTAQLKSSSTPDRIRAITTLGTINLKETAIVNMLINKLLHDDDLHVRMAAGTTLQVFNTNPEVKPAIIKAIRKEKELMVQATLIDVLIKLDKEAAIKEIYRIYESDSSSPEFKTIYKNILESKNS